MVDCKNHQILDQLTSRTTGSKSLEITRSSNEVLINKVSHENPVVSELFAKYPQVLIPRNIDEVPTKTKSYHSIDTSNSCPTFCKNRRLSPEKEDAARKEFTSLLAAGIIRPSKSPWSSPLHLVKKPTGEWRPVGDYRNLNTITKPDRYPVPHLHSVTEKLKNKNVFSKIDLMKAYHQIPVHPDDIEKTAICTPFGLYEYCFMPFGLKNSGATFQRYIDNVFLDCKCVFIYFDDILIFSDSVESHNDDLDQVFKILNDNSLKISVQKCEFFMETIDFLGFEISKDGLKPTESKISDIKSFPVPSNSKSLRRFLGVINFYRRLIPKFADIVYPLTNMIKMCPNSKTLDFSADALASFETIKDSLAKVSALAHPSCEIDGYHLVTDASNYAMGAALHQISNGEVTPIGFFSKKLSEPQVKYSAFDRELLAAYHAVLHFKPFIECRNVTIFTDHKPLAKAFRSPNPAKSDRQQRHLSLITEYISEVEYIRGDQNIVADCMSRPIGAVSIDAIDLPAIADLQINDEELVEHQSKMKPFQLNPELVLWCDTSTSFPRPFVPCSLRNSIFNEMHSLCHPGIKSSLKIIKSRYYWPDMDRDIRRKCQECLSCQQSKVNRHTKSETKQFSLPSTRFETVHIDLVGPLLPACQYNSTYSSNHKYLLTCIDRATRWMEAIPLEDTSAASVAVAFLETWISRFGVPLYVITDRGSQFESELFTELSKLIGFHRLRTTSYHPQTNGMVERMHRTLKTAIKTRKQSWLQSLPIVLYGMRSIPNENGFSPFSAVTGSYMNMPRILKSSESNFSSEQVSSLAKCMREINFEEFSFGKHHNKSTVYIPKQLDECTHVWLRIDRIRKPLEAPYTGPFLVVKRYPKVFVIENFAGIRQTVSIDRVKPALIKEDTAENSPPSTPASTPPLSIDEDVVVEDNGEEKEIEEGIIEDIPMPNPEPRQVETRLGRKIKFRNHDDYFYY